MVHGRLLVYSDTHESSATMQIRLWGPLHSRGLELIHAHAWWDRHRGQAFAGDWSLDALIIHRAVKRRCPVYPLLLAAARQQRIPVIHDIDDLLIRVPAEHPDHAVYQAKVGYALRPLLDADAVVASTPPLAEELSVLHESVLVIANELPSALWREACQRNLARGGAAAADRVTVGYVASRTHRPDLELVEEPLIGLLRQHAGRVRFVSLGVPLTPRLRREPWVEEIRPSRRIARSYAEFVRFAATLRIDVGIAPLRDTPFNRCKSDVKFQEYAALGAAGVYSDLPPYRGRVRNGENGLLAAEPSQWRDCLERLVASADLRRRLASSAAGDLRAMWQAGRAGALWEELLQRANDQLRSRPARPPHPLAPILGQMIEYQSGLERSLKRTVEYQVGRTFSRLLRRLSA